MAKTKKEIFRNMTNTELANYCNDLRSYHDEKAKLEWEYAIKEMVFRFINLFSDNDYDEYFEN